MHTLGKHLWAALLLLAALGIAVLWWGLSHDTNVLPTQLLEHMNDELYKQATPEDDKTFALNTDDSIPATQTYYRWTDNKGQTGYSLELPEQVQSFKAIILPTEKQKCHSCI